MAAAAPIIGSIIVSFVVSAAVRELGPKIGLSDNVSNLLGTVAGAYAGGYTYNSAAASQAAATTPPPDLSANVAGATAAPNVPSPAVAPPVSNIPGTPLAPQGSPYASPPSASGGMLSQGAGSDLAVGSVPRQATPPPVTPGSDTAKDIIKSGTVGGTPGADLQESWTSRLFSPEKTMDLVMAGIQGYGEAGIRKEELEYPEKVAEKDARGWAAAYPGQLSLTPYSPPSQGGN